MRDHWKDRMKENLDMENARGWEVKRLNTSEIKLNQTLS